MVPALPGDDIASKLKEFDQDIYLVPKLCLRDARRAFETIADFILSFFARKVKRIFSKNTPKRLFEQTLRQTGPAR
jgi:Na+/phosphate symporter